MLYIYLGLSVIFFCLLYFYDYTLTQSNKELEIDYLNLAICSLLFPITLIRLLVAFIKASHYRRLSKKEINLSPQAYVRKPEIVTAIKFNGANVDDIKQLIGNEQDYYELLLYIKKFDWVVVAEDSIQVYTDENFKKTFEFVGDITYGKSEQNSN